MPASIYVTKEQLAVMAAQGEDVMINENILIGDSLDCWVMDNNTKDGEHHSLIIEQDGTVVSDAVVTDKL